MEREESETDCSLLWPYTRPSDGLQALMVNTSQSQSLPKCLVVVEHFVILDEQNDNAALRLNWINSKQD